MTQSTPPGSPDRRYAVAPDDGDGRMSAPAALRNRDEIAAALAQIAPNSGRALEIAAGTGEHVIRFAASMPGLNWQPSDPADDRRASIKAWIAAEPASNIDAPIDLDACAPGWAAEHAPFDLVFFANLLHLIPVEQAETCLAEAAKATARGGILAIYGPFLRDGQTTSDGDAAFHARLSADMPGAGYKDRDWVLAQLIQAGLIPEPPRDMAANNLLLTARRAMS
ncbi:DUF938 domain-containing protein [Gymnodinialimonas sp. 2305UL16-5]|uniref:DUF938 domain-containing protein n=1 Tax=Gymnodinialimonas mytili TaxID=3126503 RepID=UPI003094B575